MAATTQVSMVLSVVEVVAGVGVDLVVEVVAGVCSMVAVSFMVVANYMSAISHKVRAEYHMANRCQEETTSGLKEDQRGILSGHIRVMVLAMVVVMEELRTWAMDDSYL